MTQAELDQLTAQAEDYAAQAGRLSFGIENRQEELAGILEAYQAMNTVSAQVLRQYFLQGGKVE
jgi:hypothetical protein